MLKGQAWHFPFAFRANEKCQARPPDSLSELLGLDWHLSFAKQMANAKPDPIYLQVVDYQVFVSC